MSVLTILPMVAVMIAGPQVISAVFLAASREARRSSVAYLAGAAIAVLVETTVFYLVLRSIRGFGGGKGGGSIDRAIDWVMVALLLVLMVLVFRRRRRSEPPKWMGKLEEAGPRFAFKLGVLLFAAMPTDVIAMVSVSDALARHSRPWWELLPFVALTLLLLALPLLSVLSLGRRALVVLPKVREWANVHSWLVSEFVILFFLTITASDLAR